MRSRASSRLTAAALALVVSACGPAARSALAPTAPVVQTAAPTSAVVGPGEPWIAASVREIIHLIRPDGSGDHVAFPSVPSGLQFHADWSPAGNRLSFTIRGETDVIWVGDVDGSNTRLAVDCQAPCVWAREAAWSPDGNALIYTRTVDTAGVGSSTLEILNLATNETRVILTAPKRWAFGQPRWSPDGSKVVTEFAQFAQEDLDGFPLGVSLAVIDLTAARPAAVGITDAATLSNSPDWSWVTNLIVFARPSTPDGFDGPSDLVTIQPDGSGAATLISVLPREGQTPQPAWSPDGSRIIFVQPNTSMATIAVDGSDLRPAIATGLGRGVHPRYRPVP